MPEEALPAPPWRDIVRHPLLRQAGAIAGAAAGTGLLVVHPDTDGWGQSEVSSRLHFPSFCKLIHSSKEGASQCRLCHVLMVVGACNGEPAVQRCYAGASVVVCPALTGSAKDLAVVSSCQFADADAVDEVGETAKRLGLDVDAVRKAYSALPMLTEERIRSIKDSMELILGIIKVLRENSDLHQRMDALHHRGDEAELLSDNLQEMQKTLERRDHENVSADAPPLIWVVCELIDSRPELPLTVKQLAASARVTPNYFSTLFRTHTGMAFTDYLTGVRIARAKTLLNDLTLSINDIARRVGYEDPGYFARRFRSATGVSPRAWRNKIGHDSQC